MAETPIITLLTDFGSRDVYVGVMKGAIARICPSARPIDLTHHIPPGDVTAGAFALLDAYPYFPPGSVHLAVIDPGVGGDRRAVAIKTAAGYFVGPDNGLFAPSLARDGAIAAVSLDNPRYWRDRRPSSTFHGRDIFAPVAAHLAGGTPLGAVGTAIDPATLTPLARDTPEEGEGQIIGRVRSIDRFGNLITNIRADTLEGRPWCAIVGDLRIKPHTTYSQVPPGDYLALVDSNGWIEIAVNRGDARERSGLRVGDPLRLAIEDQRNPE